VTAPKTSRMPATRDRVLSLLREGSARLVSLFGSVGEDREVRVHYILDDGEYRLFETIADEPIESATAITPAAAWYERELRDQFGVEIEGHPDLRRLMLHGNWPDGVHPMVDNVAQAPWGNVPYSFLKVEGDGVCEVPVGPVHAGIIEPGHFRFSVVGDTVLHLELRHFYTHKGTEKLFEGSDPELAVMIAESVSGDNCFSHAVAYCQAVEAAVGSIVPPKAEAIRLIGQELERLVFHIADVGALCGDVGFSVPAPYCNELKERLLQQSTALLGTRYWRGIAIPGGVTKELPASGAQQLRETVRSVAKEFAELAQMVLDTPSVQNRFESTGVLTPQIARDLALVGPVARASDVKIDVRHDHPYGAYKTRRVEPVAYHYGDVLARARVRIDEAAASALLLEEALEAIPAGAVANSIAISGDSAGFSAVESPRGELLYSVEIRRGQIARCHIKSPSFQNWPALPLTMPGNIIADFPLINKSFNLSYSGCDR
jgi:hydrogenase-4 component G